MGKTLVVAEKPSVGRDIARVLRCGGKGDGFLYNDEYIITWAIGHLVTLYEPEDYDSAYKRWREDMLPIIPLSFKLKPIAATKKQLDILKRLFNDKTMDGIVCATDSGREGELIFRYIYELAKCDKPVSRLWISSMTDEAIKEGFAGLKPGEAYDNLHLSARCRSEADWLVGMNATRAYTLRFGALLPIGRVQTPTLAIITTRQAEIDSFVPKNYWELHVLFLSDRMSETYVGVWFEAKTGNSRFDAEDAARAVAAKVEGKAGVVLSIETERKKRPPGLLCDLTELQRECNRRYGYSAKKTLDTAQSLYERRKLITYPRTDSRYIPPDMLPAMEKALTKLAATEYGKWAADILAAPKLPIYGRVVDKGKITDHHAIVPTAVNINLAALPTDERNVYDVVVRRFIAVFMPYYIYDAAEVITGAEGETFVTKGKTVVQWGWMELYHGDKTVKEEEEQDERILPGVVKGDGVQVEKADVPAKKTAPPKPYTEGTLLSAMENAGRFVDDEELRERLKESGLGTPATRAAIIERLIQVGYVTRRGKVLAPTEKGQKLIAVAPPELKSPETTGKWEKGLNSISQGKMSGERFMQSIERYVRYIVDSAAKAPVTVDFPKDKPKQWKKPAAKRKSKKGVKQ